MKKIEAETDIFCRCTIFRLAKPAFFRYNENFTLGHDFYVAYLMLWTVDHLSSLCHDFLKFFSNVSFQQF